MGHPSEVRNVVLDGNSLTLEQFVAVARFGAKVSVAEEAYDRMQKSRELAEKIADEGRVAYGITTGFGDFQKVAVPEEMSNQLSTNLILSHCTATGEPYSDEIVRGIMLLRANALLGGVSGVRPLLVKILAEMINKNVLPVIPEKGSLGPQVKKADDATYTNSDYREYRKSATERSSHETQRELYYTLNNRRI